MRALLVLALGGCSSSSADRPDAAAPDASTETVDRDRACADFAVAFCAKSTPCYPDIPLDWCIAQEEDLCHGWSAEPVLVHELDACTDAIRALACPPEDEDFVLPDACCRALSCPA